MFLGFFGESVPYDSGLVTLIKGHGNFNPEDQQRINHRDKTTSRQMFQDEMRITENNAIVIIRNPYHVIYSYKNYIEKGSSDHADESQFFGPGNICDLEEHIPNHDILHIT